MFEPNLGAKQATIAGPSGWGHPSQGAPPTPRSIRVRTARFG